VPYDYYDYRYIYNNPQTPQWYPGGNGGATWEAVNQSKLEFEAYSGYRTVLGTEAPIDIWSGIANIFKSTGVEGGYAYLQGLKTERAAKEAAEAAEKAAKEAAALVSPVTAAVSGDLAPSTAPPAVVEVPNANSNSLFGNLFTPGGSTEGGAPATPPGYYLIGAFFLWYVYKRFAK
jgi:hypothetical protein